MFSVRVCGNVLSDYALASIEYACKHLGTKFVLVLGHTDSMLQHMWLALADKNAN